MSLRHTPLFLLGLYDAHENFVHCLTMRTGDFIASGVSRIRPDAALMHSIGLFAVYRPSQKEVVHFPCTDVLSIIDGDSFDKTKDPVHCFDDA